MHLVKKRKIVKNMKAFASSRASIEGGKSLRPNVGATVFEVSRNHLRGPMNSASILPRGVHDTFVMAGQSNTRKQNGSRWVTVKGG